MTDDALGVKEEHDLFPQAQELASVVDREKGAHGRGLAPERIGNRRPAQDPPLPP